MRCRREGCEELFEPVFIGHRFCSTACADADQAFWEPIVAKRRAWTDTPAQKPTATTRRPKQQPEQERICGNEKCGKVFIVGGESGKRVMAKFCSRRCKAAAGNAKPKPKPRLTRSERA